MKIFARPTGDIEKLLSSLAKPNSDLILDRYKNSLNVNLVRRITNNCKQNLAGDAVQKQYDEQIAEFQNNAKKAIGGLRTIKEDLKPMVSVKENQNKNYSKVYFLTCTRGSS